MSRASGQLNLVPTRMGMILAVTGFKRKDIPCPHTHGDDPDFYTADGVYDNLSPHAWG